MTKTNSATRQFAFTTALALGAAIAGAPHAALALGSTPVTVVNPSLPVTVGNPDDPSSFAKARNAIRHSFLLTKVCRFDDTVNCAAGFDFQATNANQAIIIEDASGLCVVATGHQLLDAQIDVSSGNVVNSLFLATPDHLGANGTIPFGQLVHLSLAPNTAINFSTEIDFFTAGIQCLLSVSGEAIDQ